MITSDWSEVKKDALRYKSGLDVLDKEIMDEFNLNTRDDMIQAMREVRT